MPAHIEDKNPNNKTLTYYKVVEGFFTNNDGDKFQAIEGQFERVWTQEDPGNKEHRVKPYTKVIIDLVDDTDIHRITFHAEITFGWVMASYLNSLEKGDWVKIRVRPGEDTKVTLPNVMKAVDGNWVNVAREEFPKDSDGRLAKVKEVVAAHPALFTPKPKEA